MPTDKNYSSLMDGIGRPPTPYVERHASMSAQPLNGFPSPIDRKLRGHEPIKSNVTPDIGGSQRLGHRRNKTTVSDMSAILSSVAGDRVSLPTPPRMKASTEPPIEEHLDEEDFRAHVSFAPAQFKYEYAEQTITKHKPVASSIAVPHGARSLYKPHSSFQWNKELLQPIQESSTPESSPASSKAMLAVAESAAHDRTASTDSTGSGSTVASDSWNPIDSYAEPSYDEHKLKRKSSVVDLKTGLRPAIADPEQMTWDTVRKLYPLDDYSRGDLAQCIAVRDFAFATCKAPTSEAEWTGVRLAPTPYPTTSTHHKLEAEEPENSSDEENQAFMQHEDAHRHAEECTVPADDQYILPTLSYQPPKTSIRVIAEDAGSIFDHVSDEEDATLKITAASFQGESQDVPESPNTKFENDDDERPYGDLYFPTYTAFKLPKAREQTQPSPTEIHQRTSSIGFLRRVSAHLAKFGVKHRETEPTYTLNDDGLLNRGFQFPVREPEQQRVGSAPLLSQSDGGGSDVPTKKHTRRGSLGRWLHRLGGKVEQGGEDGEARESLLYRGAERAGEFIMRRGW
jgi:hypothetical protein